MTLDIVCIVWLYIITGYTLRQDIVMSYAPVDDWVDDLIIVFGWPVILLVVLVAAIRGR